MYLSQAYLKIKAKNPINIQGVPPKCVCTSNDYKVRVY